MFLQQYYLECLAHASYLIADEVTGTAVVVDPQRDIDQYLADAEAQGLHIRYVFLTHFHADFLAGHLELHARTGATICLGAQAQADYAFTPFRHGEALTVRSCPPHGARNARPHAGGHLYCGLRSGAERQPTVCCFNG